MTSPTPATRQTVMVAFEVFADTPEQAEREVSDRLAGVRLLMQNDSNDFRDGTADPINTYQVLPLGQILRDAL